MTRTKPISAFLLLPFLAWGARVDAGSPGAQAAANPASATSVPVQLDRLDPSVDTIVPKDAKLELVASGFTWTEGPLWIPSGGYLLFAEITSNSIRKLTPDGKVSILRQPSGYLGTAPYPHFEPGSNGMTLDTKGRVTVAGHAQRDIYRMESLAPNAPTTILADSYEGKKLNSPNDVTYRSDGSAYFTDPPFGLPRQPNAAVSQELSFSGVYRIPGAAEQKPGAAPARDRLQLLTRELAMPNGICFSPDEKYLYVNNTQPKKIWMRYLVKPDGTLDEGKVFYDATADKRRGGPDGMKVDRKGNLYSTGPAGVWIFSPEGKPLGTILVPTQTSNVAWGGADNKTLYITATGNIYRIHLNIGGK